MVAVTSAVAPAAMASTAPTLSGSCATPGAQQGDQKQYLGWIADGFRVTVADPSGVPQAGVAVTFSITGSDRGKKNMSFVRNPCLSAAAAWSAMQGSGSDYSITLVTDVNGTIALDGGANGANTTCGGQLMGYHGTWGYLRIGDEVKPEWLTLMATASGYGTQSLATRLVTPTSGGFERYYWPGLLPTTTSGVCPAPTAV
ncbi:hypothetical protein [Serinibacter salmoneus]|uniref:hypothetical protein n=1 Tax=Serinibacter salmoneus TaxID=556530 RepID=UPI000BF473D1|nr:hypothetical protein [Serinibacter salmoneus]